MEPYERYEPVAAESAGESQDSEPRSLVRSLRQWLAHVGAVIFMFVAFLVGFALGWPEPVVVVVGFAVGGGLYLLDDSPDLSDYLPPDQPDC